MKRYILLAVGTLLIQCNIIAQEHVVGLYSNPVIKHAIKKQAERGQNFEKTLEYPTSIHLPVFTDFHTDNIFPDTALFTGTDVYINADFPYQSVNIGVATLDAIDGNGNLYEDASAFPFIADYLSSRPIRLDTLFLPNETRAITLADSIYFSFFYQPQGRGNEPESFDSLVLQFGYYAGDSSFSSMDSITLPVSGFLGPGGENDTIFPFDTIYSPPPCNPGVYMINYDTLVWDDVVTIPCDSVYEPVIQWNHVWHSPGMPLDTFYTLFNTYSRQVMIPITDSAKFFREHFYFRFFNYASLANDIQPSWKSNCDQWNVDYIYLNVGRSQADTLYRDITFAERAPSFLKDFTSMPLRQYRNDPTNQLKDSLKLYITNLSADTFNVFYEYLVNEYAGSYSNTYTGGFANLYPFYLTGYQSCTNVPQHACPPRNFLFPLSSQQDSSSYLIQHVIHDQSNPDLGDTIHYIQRFYNYYAYDDGTPELGYGLSINQGKAAVRFTLNIADSLMGIGMYFNRVQNDANDNFFTLTVWDNNNGKPGNVIWEQENLKPKFSDDLYRMQIYDIDPPLPVLGTFFIGWEQTTNDLLNVGFDSHNDASAYLFYNTSGNWEQSLMEGALLMRPILHTMYDAFNIEDPGAEDAWNIYPNPVTGGLLHIENSIFSNSELIKSKTSISIYDMLGREMLSAPYSQALNTTQLQKGLYLMHITNEDRSIDHIHKVLINQ
jgi:hypothetical protein